MTLLAVEIHQLQALLQVTERTAPTRPLVLRRIAEDEVELAQAATDEAQAAIDHYDATRARARRAMIAPARQSAIACYEALVGDSANRSYPLLDEARWYLAWEYVRVGDATNARRVASSLVERGPASTQAVRAAFLLGALSMAEAAADASKYAEAERSFALAARGSDAVLTTTALDRLERSARAAGDGVVADEAARDLARAMAGPPDLSSSPGCTKDTDCKADRICERGTCIAPR